MSIAELATPSNSVQLDVHRMKGLSKLTGLIVRRPPGPGEAVMFEPCASVHTFWMKEPIDVVFCDRDGTVRGVRKLPPWRVAVNYGAHFTLELRAGEAAQLGIRRGMRCLVNELDGGEGEA
jgi:uncharacterized membrane protein (UPF0127 family)